jgi:hypothetical protein
MPGPNTVASTARSSPNGQVLGLRTRGTAGGAYCQLGSGGESNMRVDRSGQVGEGIVDRRA